MSKNVSSKAILRLGSGEVKLVVQLLYVGSADRFRGALGLGTALYGLVLRVYSSLECL
jgi:hypothetical protein